MKVARFKVRLKADLNLDYQATGVYHTLALEGTVMAAYKSPGYLQAHRPSWVVEVKGYVVELFQEDIELMTVEHIDKSGIPSTIRAFIEPDHRGFTTLPYQKE